MANRDNSHIGRAYQEHVLELLRQEGYVKHEVDHRHESGVEVDLLMQSRTTGEFLYVETKCSQPGTDQPGMYRSDNILKFLGSVHILATWQMLNPDQPAHRLCRYTLITSDLPSRNHNAYARALWLELELGTIDGLREVPWGGWHPDPELPLWETTTSDD